MFCLRVELRIATDQTSTATCVLLREPTSCTVSLLLTRATVYCRSESPAGHRAPYFVTVPKSPFAGMSVCLTVRSRLTSSTLLHNTVNPGHLVAFLSTPLVFHVNAHGSPQHYSDALCGVWFGGFR